MQEFTGDFICTSSTKKLLVYQLKLIQIKDLKEKFKISLRLFLFKISDTSKLFK